MKIELTFPDGLEKCLTTSYDDGVLQDRKIVALFNQAHIKCTFNLNSGFFGQTDTHRDVDHSHMPKEEIAALYQGHEVAIHTVSHPSLTDISDTEFIRQVIEDKKAIEACVQYEVTGSAYPNGRYNAHVIEMLRQLGIQYARTTHQTEDFSIPENFLEWKTTCRHANPKLLTLTDRFLHEDGLKLFYVWGHSYEFDIDQNWDLLQEFCTKIGNKSGVWYATNKEVYEYITAYRNLVFGDDNKIVYNPSHTDVTLKCGEQLVTAKKYEIVLID